MTCHKILLFETPTEDEIHIDGITFSNREFIEEIINTLQGINMYNGHDTDTKSLLDYYFNFFSSEAKFPEQIVIKYTDDLVIDDYVLEYIQNNAIFVFTIDNETIKYESLEEVSEELALIRYEEIIEFIKSFS